MSIDDAMPDIHNFSDGYYLVNGLVVEPNERISEPRLQQHTYRALRDEYYGATGIKLLFRHSQTKYHFRVTPDSSVQSRTIEVPFELIDHMGLDYVPCEEQFLLAKPGHAETLVELSNPTPGEFTD